MSPLTPLWPAQLDHLRVDTDDPIPVIAFYRDALGMTSLDMSDGSVLMHAPHRRIVIGRGARGAQPYIAFRAHSSDQLERLRAHLARRDIAALPSPSLVFGEDAFAVLDPDGRQVVFGLPRADLPNASDAGSSGAARLPGRLQHVVVATRELPSMLMFYEQDLGFLVSDYVLDGTQPAVGFFRSDPEHHSFAAFRCPESRPDHHSYEAGSWNDLRDWADHFASLHIPIWWGPGRHGPGNNLFLMVEDPQGYLVEISAELERVPDGVVKRTWPHEERTLNLWGPAFMRS